MLAAETSSDMQFGSRGAQVKQLQGYLNVVMNLRLETTSGIFGPNTEAAVRGFQTTSGMPDTGKVDSVTWQSLLSAYKTRMGGTGTAATQPKTVPTQTAPAGEFSWTTIAALGLGVAVFLKYAGVRK